MIGLLGGNRKIITSLRTQLLAGTEPAISALAWFEFLCGPEASGVTDHELDAAEAFVSRRIVPLDSATSFLGARLFNQTGRRKGSQADCLIAATAIQTDAALFTENVSDFRPFEHFGLTLV